MDKPAPAPLQEDQALEVKEEERPPPAPKDKPPRLEIDESGVRVNHELFLVDRDSGLEGLTKELEAQAKYIEGRDFELSVHRKAKLQWVARFLKALDKVGVGNLEIQTDTREDYPKSLTFSPLARAKDAPACSVVSVISEDRTTATWKLSGGKARQRRRGLGGPDLSMTAATIESVAKGCQDSDALFLSAFDGVEWGLLYDLAGSTKQLEKASFKRFVVLGELPVAGKKVQL